MTDYPAPEGVVRFDPATGRLGLDRIVFEVLVAVLRDGAPPAGASEGTALLALARAGVLGGDRGTDLHPVLRGPLRTVLRPVGRLALRLQVEGRPEATVEGWIGAAMAVLLVEEAGHGSRLTVTPRYELLALHRAFLPAVLARLTGVGTIPSAPPADGQAPSERAEPGAAGGGWHDRQGAAPLREHPGGVAEVTWSIVVRWVGGDGVRQSTTPGRAVRGRLVGATLWLDDPGDQATAPKVASRTAAWRALLRLVSGEGGVVPAVSAPAGG